MGYRRCKARFPSLYTRPSRFFAAKGLLAFGQCIPYRLGVMGIIRWDKAYDISDLGADNFLAKDHTISSIIFIEHFDVDRLRKTNCLKIRSVVANSVDFILLLRSFALCEKS